MNYGIFFFPFSANPVPHANTRTAGISKYFRSNFFKGIDIAIALDSVPNLFGTWCNCEFGFGLQSFVGYLSGKTRSAGNIFIRRVGTRSDQTYFDVCRPTVLLCLFFHF